MNSSSIRGRIASVLLAIVFVVGSICVEGPVTAAKAGSTRAAATLAELSGRVYEGEPGTEPPQSTPLEGVLLTLYGSNSNGYLGVELGVTARTDSSGWYSLQIPESPVKEFYHIVETDPDGYISAGASTVDGVVMDANWIQYAYPLTGKTLTGNKFWDQLRATRTPTLTPTSIPPTLTYTATRTTVPPTATPTPTRTAIPPTATQTATGTRVLPTDTPTRTPTGVPGTATPTLTATRPVETPTLSPTPTGTLPPGCVDLLVNGDFESGALPPWSSSGAVGVGPGRVSAHGAWLGGTNNATGELVQSVTIPAGASPVRLEFWWMVESEVEQPADALWVLLQQPGGPVWLRTWRAVSPFGQWHLDALDLTAYAGQTIAVTFLVNTDGQVPSTFRIDDVSLKACGGAFPSPTATQPGALLRFRGHINTLTDPPLVEPIPAHNVRVALFGSNNADLLGELLASTQSGEDGAYSLSYGMATQAAGAQSHELQRGTVRFDYYHIAVTDPGYRVLEASSGSGGQVTEAHWIRFPHPDPGDYPDNNFIVELVAVVPRAFSGTVYLGEPGDRSNPLRDVPVRLYKALLHCEQGTDVARARTDALGRFTLEYLTPAGDDAPYYNLAVDSEDLHVAGAQSLSGAVLTSEGWLQFARPPSGVLGGNDFFVGSLSDKLQATFAADADAYISEKSPGTNYGSSSTLRTSFDSGAASSERALLQFDLSIIPSSVTAQKATLHLYLQEAGGATKVCMSVHAVQEPWCEGPLCAGQVPVTWNKQPSYNSHASAEHVVDTALGYKVWDVTALVQAWVSHPISNTGLVLLGPEEGADWSRIFSSLEGSYPPYLTVYLPPQTHLVTPTPTQAPIPIALDLQVDAIEVTQAIQCKGNSKCADNAVPMIAGKATFARVYVKVTGSSAAVANVSAEVIAKVGGKQLTAMQINSTITAKLSPDRAQFDDTLNFYLCGVSSSGTLEVEVNPFGTIPESNYSNNKKTVNLNFVTTPSLRIVPIWIYYTAGGQKEIVDWSMPGYLNGYLNKVLPVGDIQWYLLSNPVLTWNQAIGPDKASWDTLLAKIADLRNKNTSMPSDAHWYGMIPFKMPTGSISGIGYQPGYAAAGRVPVQHENLEDAADNMAHELGHNLGREHAPCGLDPGEKTDASYPYSNAIIGDYGWDMNFAAGGKVASYPDGFVVPKTSYDLMSYCQDEWVSEYTYRGILAYRGSTAAAAGNADDTAPGTQSGSPQAASAEPRPYLFASGSISGEVASLAPCTILDRPAGSNDAPGEGPFQLRLTAGNGSTLFERHFDVQTTLPSLLPEAPSLAAQDASLPFYEILPWQPDTARVQVWQGGQLLTERVVSAHAPTVELTSPHGGDLWGGDGPYVVEWQAGDADGDALWFDVAFSRDNGETWEVIATRLQEHHLEVHGDQFPGTENARMRVYASDGVRTSAATSAPFAVARKPPQVFIAAPERGVVVPPGALVIFSGYAYDREDGPLATLPLHWRSNRDGALGDGSEIAVQSLSPGWHEIGLSATDSDGMVGSAKITIFVGQRLYLPVVLKRRSSW